MAKCGRHLAAAAFTCADFDKKMEE